MSKSDTWMPFYVADYLADTMHFKTVHHGAYVLLIMAVWKAGGSVPDDDEQLSAITRQGAAEFRRMRPILGPKFEIGGGEWRHKRVTIELGKATAKYESKVANGKRGGRGNKANDKANGKRNESETKDNHNHNNTTKATASPSTSLENNGFASQTLSGLPPDESTTTDETSSDERAQRKVANGRKLADEARAVLTFLNERAGKNFPDTSSNVGIIVARFREGFTPGQLRQVIAMKVREWRGDEKCHKYLRPDTLFGRTKFSNYVGELVTAPDDEGAAQ